MCFGYFFGRGGDKMCFGYLQNIYVTFSLYIQLFNNYITLLSTNEFALLSYNKSYDLI